MRPQAYGALVVVVVSISLGLIFKLPEQWFYTEFSSTPQPQGTAEQRPEPNAEKDGIQKDSVQYQCNTNSSESVTSMWQCRGWLYTPTRELSLQNKANQFPLIIMAHGIAATKDQGLESFALQFAKNGFMVLVFDYLHFGESDGVPRQRLNPLQHVMDYRSTIKYGQSLENVDRSRIALWGTSYAGGHVLVTASQEKSNVKAVISQMPFLGALPSENPLDELKKRGYLNVLKGLVGAISSVLRQQFGMPPLYSRIYGHIGDGSKLALNYWENFDGSDKKWLAKHPAQRPNDWRNAVSTDSLLQMMKYKPHQHIHDIDTTSTKVLVVKAKHDLMCPNYRMDYVIRNLQCESHTEDTTHFGMYTGQTFTSVIKVQIEFFKKHLRPKHTMKVLD